MPSISAFISSTSVDLQEHRAAVVTACMNSGFHPIDMANFMARDQNAVRTCLEEVAKADVFVGIYAWRYGYIPEGSDCSITEMEFNKARELGIPCFCFMVDPGQPWPAEYKDSGIAAQYLANFKNRIDRSLVRATFTSPGDLAGKVAATFSQWGQRQKAAQTAGIENVAEGIKAQAEAQRLDHENRLLEARLDDLYRQRPERVARKTNQNIEGYLVVLGGLLIVIAILFSLSQLLGIFAVLGSMGLLVYRFMNRGQSLRKIDREIAQIQRQLAINQQKIQNILSNYTHR